MCFIVLLLLFELADRDVRRRHCNPKLTEANGNFTTDFKAKVSIDKF